MHFPTIQVSVANNNLRPEVAESSCRRLCAFGNPPDRQVSMVSRCLEFHMDSEPAEPSYGAAAAAVGSAINNSMPMSLTVNVGAPVALGTVPAFPMLPPPELPRPPPPVVHVQKSCVSSNTNRAWKLLSENTEEEKKQEEMKLQKKVRTSASASLQAAAAAIRAAKNLHKIEGELTKEPPLSQAVGERTKKRHGGASADAAQAKKKAAKTLAPQAALKDEDKEDKEESSKPLVEALAADTPGGESSLARLEDSSLRASGSSVNGSAGSASGSLVIGDGNDAGSLVNGDGNASGSLVNGDGNVSVSLGTDPHSTPPRSSAAQAPLGNNLLTGEKQPKPDTSQQGDCQDADFQSQPFSDMLFEDGPEPPSEHHGAQPPDTLAGSAEADEEAAAVEAAEADEADEAAEELKREVKEEVADEGDEAARKKARAKKGTIGTFAGRRPPKNEQKLREFMALRDHYKEILKQLKEDNKMKAKPRFKSPCQNKYCAFMSSKMAELAKAGVSGGLRMKQAAQAWKKQQAAELGLDGA